MLNKEMWEIDKVFEDFSKSCDVARKACQDFIDMDINKTAKPTLETQRDEAAGVHVYELWFLGDIVGEPQAKSRATLNKLLQEAQQMLTDAVAAEPTLNYGEAEIVHRWGEFGEYNTTVWSMGIDEFKKVIR